MLKIYIIPNLRWANKSSHYSYFQHRAILSIYVDNSKHSQDISSLHKKNNTPVSPYQMFFHQAIYFKSFQWFLSCHSRTMVSPFSIVTRSFQSFGQPSTAATGDLWRCCKPNYLSLIPFNGGGRVKRSIFKLNVLSFWVLFKIWERSLPGSNLLAPETMKMVVQSNIQRNVQIWKCV